MKLKFKNQDGIKYSIKFKKPDARKHGQCAGFCYYPHNGKADIEVSPSESNQIIFFPFLYISLIVSCLRF